MSARPRLVASDALRALATVGVIVIHASAWGPADPYASLQLIARFSVPAFMTLTGILLAYQYSDRELGASFMRRRLGRTLVPWLAWVPVYVVFDLLIGAMQRTPASFSYMFRTGGGHLWYLLLIPQLYVVFALWPRRRSWTLAIVAMVVQTALCLLRIYAVLPGWAEQVMLTYGFLLFPFWIGYFAVGVALGRTLLTRAAPVWPASPAMRRLVIIAGAPLVAAAAYLLLNLGYAGAPWARFLAGTGAFLNPVLPLLVLAIVFWMVALAPALLRRWSALARFARTLGDLSLGVYIVHPILLWLIGRLLVNTFTAGVPLSLLPWSVFVLLTLLASMLVTRLLAATPLAITIGMRRTPIEVTRLPLTGSRGAAAAG
jgi:peptidoglycan/LPS O-acetylase OafA/YrhL